MNYISALLAVIAAFSANAQHSPVFPQPYLLVVTSDSYAVNGALRYNYSDELAAVLVDVVLQYNELHGLNWQPAMKREQADVFFSRQPDLDPEAYGLIVDKSGIKITYGSRSGLLYALQTLDQWIGNTGKGAIAIPGVKIEDSPAFGYRGLHLDCSRHFFTIPEIRKLLGEMARLKLNTFHWHLTDDQGWRIEIRQYPKLTAKGAWRDSTVIGHYSRTPREYEKKHYGGFYTQEEAKEIVRYAASLGITVIPEIELPGHARAALNAYPELGCTGEQLPVEGLWGVFDDIFCSKPETLDFLKNVLTEIMEIFPSETIHIGGDEAPKVRWDACPRCKEVREANGLHNSHELQSYVVGEMEVFLRAHGRKLMGWDEILEGGLADNAQVMSWRGNEGGIAAAKQHHPVVMTPTAFCYLDYYQSGHPDEPLAIGGFLPLEKVYSFNPIPKELTDEEKQYIIGGQANLWTEYLPEMKDVYYNLFPRLIAMSEVLWTKQPGSYFSFVESMAVNYLPRLEVTGIPYSTAFLDPKLVAGPGKGGIEYKITAPLSSVSFSVDGQAMEQFTLRRTNSRHAYKMDLVASYAGKPLRTTGYVFTNHSRLGKPVRFTTPPNPKFNHNDSLALTDGVQGKRPWKGDQWLGFSNDTVQFSIDLGSKTAFTSVELGCLNDPGSWIYKPKRIRIETSSDRVNYTLIKEAEVTSETISETVKAKARYVRITLINDTAIPEGNSGAGNTPWTFIDELMIN